MLRTTEMLVMYRVFCGVLCITFLATSLLGDQVASKAELTPRVQLSSLSLKMGDPLYAKVTLSNETTVPVELPGLVRALPNISASTSHSDYVYQFKFRNDFLQSRSQTIEPGGSVSKIILLEMPPLEKRKDAFWQSAAQHHNLILTFSFANSDAVKEDDIRIEVRFGDRSEQEWDSIEAPIKESKGKHFNISVVDVRWKPGAPLVYLCKFVSDSQMVADDLLNKKKHISPGALRNVLIAREYLIQIANRNDTLTNDERRKVSNALLEWMKTLDEVEAEYLADYFWQNFTYSLTHDPELAQQDDVFVELHNSLRSELGPKVPAER